jgi:hypothetical protein
MCPIVLRREDRQYDREKEEQGELNAAAIKVATAIGPIHFSDGDKTCEPMNVSQAPVQRQLA